MQFIQESEHERSLRRILSCTHTLYSVVEELTDPEEIELRGDLLIAVENLIDVADIVTDMARDIAWQYSPTPAELESDSD